MAVVEGALSLSIFSQWNGGFGRPKPPFPRNF
jgi:hypothetical protein